MKSWKTPLGLVRLLGLVEGASFLLLLGVAMPLKYLAGIPLAVKIVGWTHGVLFMMLCVAIGHAMVEIAWPLRRAAMVFVAALLPFGPFVIDKRLRSEEKSLEAVANAAEPKL